MQTTLKIKGGEITVQFSYKGLGKRIFTFNGQSIENAKALYFTNEEIGTDGCWIGKEPTL